MAEYRVIEKSEDSEEKVFYPEVRKKLFWHNLKESKGQTNKSSYSSFQDAKEFVLKKIKECPL